MKQDSGTVRKESRSMAGRITARVKESRRRVGTLAAIAIAMLLGYHVVAGNNGLSIYKQKLVEEKQLAAEVQAMQQDNDRLKKHVDHLATDPDAIEAEAHDRLRYTMPGQVIVLNEGEASKDTEAMPR